MSELAIRRNDARLDVDLQSALEQEQVEVEQTSSVPAEGWVMMAERSNDGLRASLHTLGGLALADTPSKVRVYHKNGVDIDKEGPLAEMAPIYKHPMAYATDEEAKTAFPPPSQRAA